jgi:hypothetical protein
MIADKGPATPLAALERGVFIHQFLEMFSDYWFSLLIEQNFEMYDVAWWVRSQEESIEHPNCEKPNRHVNRIHNLFSDIHLRVSRNIVFHHMSAVH